MSLRITVDNTPLADIFARIGRQFDDLTPFMSAIGMEMETRISWRFETQTDPLGVAWMPWKESTVKKYPKGGNKRLLDCFGDMLASLNHSADAESVTIGFGDPKAAYHEWGTIHMDRRGLLFADPDSGTLSPDDERALVDIGELVFSQQIGRF